MRSFWLFVLCGCFYDKLLLFTASFRHICAYASCQSAAVGGVKATEGIRRAVGNNSDTRDTAEEKTSVGKAGGNFAFKIRNIFIINFKPFGFTEKPRAYTVDTVFAKTDKTFP